MKTKNLVMVFVLMVMISIIACSNENKEEKREVVVKDYGISIDALQKSGYNILIGLFTKIT